MQAVFLGMLKLRFFYWQKMTNIIFPFGESIVMPGRTVIGTQTAAFGHEHEVLLEALFEVRLNQLAHGFGMAVVSVVACKGGQGIPQFQGLFRR